MQLFDKLTHMPFLDGSRMVFCESLGVGEFSPPRSFIDIRLNVAPRVFPFQMWSPVIKDGDTLTALKMPFATRNPNCVYCTPVLSGNKLSFCFNRALWTADIDGDRVVNQQIVQVGIFTGFSIDGRTVLAKDGCATGSQIVEPGTQAFSTAFRYVLRVIPHLGGYIVTGGDGEGHFYSVFIDTDLNAFRIQVLGEDVYKCVLSADNKTVIYAKRVAGAFEDRYLFTDDAELTPEPGFVKGIS